MTASHDETSRFRRDLRRARHEAWERLFQEQAGFVRGLCRNLLPPSGDAEDAFGTTWHKAFAKARRYDGTRDPRRWLAQICTRTCYDQTRRRGRRARRTERYARREEIGNGPGAPSDATSFGQPTPMQQLVTRMPHAFREAVVLRHYMDLPTNEVAEILRIQPESARKRLQRAMTWLRAHVDRESELAGDAGRGVGT